MLYGWKGYSKVSKELVCKKTVTFMRGILCFLRRIGYIKEVRMKIENAIIKSMDISIERGFILDCWLHLDYGGLCQGFGGYALYLSKTAKHHNKMSGAGHHIYNIMEIADVDKWENLKGKTIRVKSEDGLIKEIGHIVKDKWYNPSKELKEDK